ncbi:unnamed protein product [Vitrella brassicaformis CCMP3155]|uniref:Uncharacterized protein n=1 Tax=Vitrella brassicaformis (strain CCMP3155) TaxID=1169540 RepID=A0A0G4EUI8_VITBC|nr:unnamed protein product [Vitrella brassicaformis CCMP3155]|eukprot:CEM02093.1 unnamed protein product [Vitrella brassicaformis CCMP3155]
MMRLGIVPASTIVALAIVLCGAGAAAARGEGRKQAACPTTAPPTITTNYCNVTTEEVIPTYLTAPDEANVTTILTEIVLGDLPENTTKFVYLTASSDTQSLQLVCLAGAPLDTNITYEVTYTVGGVDVGPCQVTVSCTTIEGPIDAPSEDIDAPETAGGTAGRVKCLGGHLGSGSPKLITEFARVAGGGRGWRASYVGVPTDFAMLHGPKGGNKGVAIKDDLNSQTVKLVRDHVGQAQKQETIVPVLFKFRNGGQVVSKTCPVHVTGN